MNKKAVVTGGAGFIGSHLVDALIGRGYRVVILDDLSTGNRHNIDKLIDSKRVQFVYGSVTDRALLLKTLKDASYVFHAAALCSVQRSLKHPLPSHRANATGTLHVLQAAKENHVEKVIYSSSSSVYGDTAILPKREDMIPSPQSPYAVSKLAGEHYCQVYQEVYGIAAVCLRYFNVYGPRQNASSEYAAAIPKFMSSIMNNKPVTIYGNGIQTRDFTFVGDVVEANVLAAESDITGVFNIGTSRSTSINNLVGMIARIAGGDIFVTHTEPRKGEIRHSLADIAKARAFGYLPRHTLEDGLRITWKT